MESAITGNQGVFLKHRSSKSKTSGSNTKSVVHTDSKADNTNDSLSVHTVDIHSTNGTDVSSFPTTTSGISVHTNDRTSGSDAGNPGSSELIRQILSTSHTNNSNTKQHTALDSNNNSNNNSTININGKMYRQVQTYKITYRVSNHQSHQGYSLVDRGANGGVVGNDARIIEKTNRFVTLTGLGNHQERDLPLCTAAAYTTSHIGPIILIMHQYAHIPDSKTIHSSIQLEAYKITVDEKSRTWGQSTVIHP